MLRKLVFGLTLAGAATMGSVVTADSALAGPLTRVGGAIHANLEGDRRALHDLACGQGAEAAIRDVRGGRKARSDGPARRRRWLRETETLLMSCNPMGTMNTKEEQKTHDDRFDAAPLAASDHSLKVFTTLSDHSCATLYWQQILGLGGA